MKRILFISLLLICGVSCGAQINDVLVDNIKSLRIVADRDVNKVPIVNLRGGRIEISFDDMSHEYKRYIYKIVHLDASWNPSTELLESDYLNGINDETLIEGYTQSVNTTHLYTHYSLTLPNQDLSLILSGNYCVEISTENEESGDMEVVAKAYFSVCDNGASLITSVTTNTEIDWNANHQQIAVTANFQNLRVSNPKAEFKLVAIQNRRWDNAIVFPEPNFVTGNSLQWKNDKKLIFKAGNEFHKYEILDLHSSGINVERIAWFEPSYHVLLFADKPRKNYSYDEDNDGGYVIRTDESSEYYDTESDYAFVHFTLDAEPRLDGDYYIWGRFANGMFKPEYKMIYDTKEKAYEQTLLLKQGYYNYIYLFLPHDGENKVGRTADVEGDFYETENEYSVYLYYHPIGARYDRLVGFRSSKFTPNKN